MLTPEQKKLIEDEAVKYADENYVWPKNKKGEDMCQLVGHANPPFYKKQTTKIKLGYIAGATAYAEKAEGLVKAINRVLQGELNPTNILTEALNKK